MYILSANEKCDSKDAADKLVSAGKAQMYSKGALNKIQDAFKHIVLLG